MTIPSSVGSTRVAWFRELADEESEPKEDCSGGVGGSIEKLLASSYREKERR